MGKSATSFLLRALVFLAALVVIYLAYYLLWHEPTYLLPDWANRLEPKDLIQAENSARATLIQAIGGTVLLIGLLFTWRTLKATLRNVELTQDKQVTERFAKAVEQLGSTNATLRLGGIYSLARIARESNVDHWTVMEVLTSVIRESAVEKHATDRGTLEGLVEMFAARFVKNEPDKTTDEIGLSTEILAIVQVLKERQPSDEDGNRHLNLEGAILWNVDFTEANLKGVNLRNSNLQGTRFYRAQLQNADLRGACLWGTDLTEANLERANLTGAQMEGSILIGTNVKGATMYGANLTSANLMDIKNFTETQRLSAILANEKQIDT